MTSPRVQTPDSRKVLANLAIVAAGFVRGRGRLKAREHLRVAIHEANQALRADGTVDVPTDPEALIRAYLKAGGNWQSLVAAISRMALEGATWRRP
ncbi:MAG: hypothetical protein CMO06_09715 [Thalassospira sp.]|jgi:hypothetical protein|uniref:hypothetical protein n=1 Tax=Thalassospira sp. TaxID=1912094 RepID=UPI000C5038B6|nr:hypothetical protein [Thalassospira sp.]MAZ33408.1 hypothetical protein [Thalassospira sp.]